MTQQIPSGQESVKEFLLEDFRNLAESFWKNEIAGETRVNFFITLVTAVLAGLVAFMTSLLSDENGITVDNLPDYFYQISGTFLLALLLLGLITMQRILKRNTVTDGYKKDMDEIRQRFKDYFDEDGFLTDYHPFGRGRIALGLPNGERRRPQSGSNWLQTSMRKPGGLAYLVLSINMILFFGVIKGFFRDMTYSQELIAVVSFFVFQVIWVCGLEYFSQKRLARNRITHAGGVVFSGKGEGVKFLLVTPREDPKEQWVFPKGHVEKGESHKETAIRELREETGYFANPLRPLGVYGYALPADHGSAKTDKTDKTLIVCKYYLMECLSTQMRASAEKRKMQWVSYADAQAQLTFADARLLLEQARYYLQKKS